MNGSIGTVACKVKSIRLARNITARLTNGLSAIVKERGTRSMSRLSMTPARSLASLARNVSGLASWAILTLSIIGCMAIGSTT